MSRNHSPWRWFVANLAEQVASPLDPGPIDDGAAAIRSWQTRFRSRYAELLGPVPGRVPLNVEVLGTEDCARYRRDRIVYDTEAHMSVPAYLLVPHSRARPGPAVLAQHGHGAGKDEVCGLDGGDEARRAEMTEHNGDYAHQLAERGYVVLAPDLRTFGERADWNPPNLYGCDLTHTHAAMLGYDVLTLDLWDLARGLDLLCSHPLVDPERVGMVGLSFGGTATLFLAAWDERVRAAVVSGYFSAWGDCAAIPWNMCGSQVLHGLVRALDHVDLGTAIAPRSLLIESGTRDGIFPVAAAEREHGRLARAYEALGVADRLELDVFEGGHRWNGVKAYPFLERWLGPPDG